MLVPINLTGGSYEHKSRPLSTQKTRNFWPQPQVTQKAKSPYVLQSFYGLKTWKENAGNFDRGVLVNQGTLYKVTDTTLYSISSDGTHTALGTIPGSNRCILKGMDGQVIVNNGNGSIYIWNGTTLTQNTDVNLGNPRGLAVINSQAIYDQGTGQGWDVSDTGLPGTISGLNNAKAESQSDALLIPYAFKETLYLMGVESIEPWWNSGQGNPPFDKLQGGVINVGLAAIHSVAENPDLMFFLGTDNQIHSLTGGVSSIDNIVSTPALTKKIQDYAVKSDAIGWCMELEGQWFYSITFPVEDITHTLPIGGEWFEWGSSLNGRIRANGFASIYGKYLVPDYNSGNIYELDAETYTDAGENIVRTRVCAPIHAGLFKQDGKAFEINELQIFLETGVGLISGQGSNPLVGICVSRDGGKTFGTQRLKRAGKLGEKVTVIMKNFGRFDKDCVIEISVSDPIYWVIYGAMADIEFCI